ncbi:xylan 1,4-beta-xylosidase [Flavobacterium nitrogenifigens]|uniref:Xylan 1,4-beta-xylosidase n=2 Tax=Flavobacterium TaxID=237 RepID=A0A7W7IXZ6_9FLAO|nr:MULTISPECIES: glycoside hydrolase family 43 protein [Flavobacterium]MBB4802676.1 xylan 1,4-beta-xylosidase [Flavobacterium nitrogenifigens]MBB6387634.1 xylan 1,4-beta-xylosidase [Flavobacterium notoginsengisoli]
MIQNPILKGFNPDPSICRVGDDYYIATSTFEWFPGVQIHHSKDLKNWKVIAHPLNRISQLDMKGVPDSCGVWAPCLSHKNGIFYLVYTNVKSFDGVWKDTPNYVVTTNDILGDWSEPVYLTSAGFDGSFFHDNDGKTWYINMLVDHRKGKFFGGIELQEYDTLEKKLIGEIFYLTSGTNLGFTEGPHLYKRNDYYYLILAEGGTEYGHAETVMRSENISGPYEAHPENPILTARNSPEYELQKAGHASFVETQNSDWYVTFLVSRPLTVQGRCILGRETAIEEIIWKNDWPYLNSGSNLPRLEIPSPNLKEVVFSEIPERENFDSDQLPIDFQTLRIPQSEEWISLTERSGFLRLKGKESLTSTHTQALVARRLQHFKAEITTSVRFEPLKFQHLAGLVLYYNTGHYHYLHITKSGNQKIISIVSCCNYTIIEQKEIIIVTDIEEVFLRATINHDKLQFRFSKDGNHFEKIGEKLDMSILSDDYVRDESERYRPAFTGCLVGLCCQDLATNAVHADFDWFEYKILD